MYNCPIHSRHERNNMNTFETHKPLTPMKVLAISLAKFKDLPFCGFKMLNRQRYKHFSNGYDSFTRKPINFDCIYLFKLNRALSSFSFSFNFKNVEPTVRATVKISEKSDVEYSKEYTVPEMKELMTSFFENNSFFSKDTFIKKFCTHFGVLVSHEIPNVQMKAIKAEFVQKMADLNKGIKESQRTMSDIKVSEKTRELWNELASERNELINEKIALLKYGLLDVPAEVRRAVLAIS